MVIGSWRCSTGPEKVMVRAMPVPPAAEQAMPRISSVSRLGPSAMIRPAKATQSAITLRGDRLSRPVIAAKTGRRAGESEEDDRRQCDRDIGDRRQVTERHDGCRRRDPERAAKTIARQRQRAAQQFEQQADGDHEHETTHQNQGLRCSSGFIGDLRQGGDGAEEGRRHHGRQGAKPKCAGVAWRHLGCGGGQGCLRWLFCRVGSQH